MRRRQRERWKNNNRSISKKGTFNMQHTFLYISLPLLCTTTTWNFQKLPSYTFYGGNVVHVLVHFFFTAAHFFFFFISHFLMAASICNFLTAATKCFCCSSNKKCLLCFSSLSFSCSIFQISGYDNNSKLNTLDNTDTETIISAFRFRLYWLFSCLCFTRSQRICDFPPK